MLFIQGREVQILNNCNTSVNSVKADGLFLCWLTMDSHWFPWNIYLKYPTWKLNEWFNSEAEYIMKVQQHPLPLSIFLDKLGILSKSWAWNHLFTNFVTSVTSRAHTPNSENYVAYRVHTPKLVTITVLVFAAFDSFSFRTSRSCFGCSSVWTVVLAV